MSHTVPTAVLSMPLNSIDSDCEVADVVRDGLLAACGSLKAAAITMGIDQGQLTRELQNGAFKVERLQRLSPQERAIVMVHLHDAFAPLADPAAYAMRSLDRMQLELNTVRQFILGKVA